MPWLYNKDTGDVLHANAVEWAADQLVPGQADINLGIPDNATLAQAVTAAQKYATAHNTTTPTTSSSQANANAQKTVAKKTVGAIVGSLGNLAGFLGVGSISGTNLVIRAAKVIIGGVLLIVGLVHITGAGGTVGSIARKVPVPI
jgi:sulfite exporter TauE/SafE